MQKTGHYTTLGSKKKRDESREKKNCLEMVEQFQIRMPKSLISSFKAALPVAVRIYG